MHICILPLLLIAGGIHSGTDSHIGHVLLAVTIVYMLEWILGFDARGSKRTSCAHLGKCQDINCPSHALNTMG